MYINLYKNKTSFILPLIMFLIFILPKGLAQETVRVMSYNMKSYNTGSGRDLSFISVISPIKPDIYVGVEINSSTGAEELRDSVLNQIDNGTYAMGDYKGSGSNNDAIFYRSDKFTFVSSTKVAGSNGNPRTYEFVLTHSATGRQIIIFGVHLPSSGDVERVTHVSAIRGYTDAYTGEVYFIAAGDFNFTDATENSFNDLVDKTRSGYFIDPEGYDGTESWDGDGLLKTHNNTKSTWYRHDLFLNSQSVVNSGGIEYIPGSFKIPGNIDGTSASVPQVYKDASDHLPVYADYLFYEVPSPVELSSFTGVLNGDHIDLHWRTETEVNNYGFSIERLSSMPEVNWESIGFIEGHGNSNSPIYYNYTDRNIQRSGTYKYRLKQIDNDGSYEYSNIINVYISLPGNYYLSQNFPNPFNPETRIDYTLPERQFVSLRFYNTLGELVAELVDEIKEAGKYSVIFDGSQLPSGIYIYTLETQKSVLNKKMTLLK